MSAELPGGEGYRARWAAVRAAWEHPALREPSAPLGGRLGDRQYHAQAVLTDAARVLLGSDESMAFQHCSAARDGREDWATFSAAIAPHVAARVEAAGTGDAQCWEAGPGWEPVAGWFSVDGGDLVLWRRRVGAAP